MSAMAESFAEPALLDKFRLKEKAIKGFMKGLSNGDKTKKKRKKVETNINNIPSPVTFQWSEVIDIRAMIASGELVDVKKCESHDPTAEVYKLLGSPDGFYIVLGALTSVEQLKCHGGRNIINS